MRYICLDSLFSHIKKIPWKEVQKKHLEDIKFIDSENNLEYINWEDIEKKHLDKLRSLKAEQRKKYINKNPDWNILQKAMILEYGAKCWYSEAPIGNGDFEIDHFRPKNCARLNDDSKTIYKQNGYWWLAYYWRNYRLSGVLANIRRRDRLKPDSNVGGKGDYFPLDLERGKVANDDSSTFCEEPILIDPTHGDEVGLLTFDADGKIIPNPLNDEYENRRALETIDIYHLDLDQLESDRGKIWDLCKNAIEECYIYYKESDSYEAKKLAVKNCFGTLNKSMDKKAYYSSVAIACFNSYNKRDGYKDILEKFRF